MNARALVRLQVNADTDRFDVSPGSADLIQWPQGRVFLRLGVAGQFNGE